MNRLTERTKDGYIDKEECAITTCSDKLGQLEDIEEEIGIDLITLFHKRSVARFIGYVWYRKKIKKRNGKEIEAIIKREVINVQHNGILVVRSYDVEYVTGLKINEYGKAWALTREELL